MTAVVWPTLQRPAAAAVAAVLLRLGLALARGTLARPELFETERIVRNLLAGRGYTYEFLGAMYAAFHSTLPYDLLTAGVYALTGGSQTAMLVVEWGCTALACLVVGRLGARLGGPAVAGFSAWLVAIHPGLLIYDATKLAQLSLDVLLIAASVLAFVRWAEHPALRRAAVAGLLTGLVMYERGTLGLFFVGAVGCMKSAGGLSWKRWAQQGVLYALCSLFVVAPWMTRNARIYDRFVPMMSTTWMALWTGNHVGTTGTVHTDDGRPVQTLAYPPLRAALRGATTEMDQMDAFRDATRIYFLDHPDQAWQVYWRKLGFFWWRSPVTGLLYPPVWTQVYTWWYLGLLLSGLVGLWVTMRRQQSWVVVGLLLWLAVSFSAVQSLFYVGGRHRWFIEPLLGTLSAAGCRSIWQAAASWRRRVSQNE